MRDIALGGRHIAFAICIWRFDFGMADQVYFRCTVFDCACRGIWGR